MISKRMVLTVVAVLLVIVVAVAVASLPALLGRGATVPDATLVAELVQEGIAATASAVPTATDTLLPPTPTPEPPTATMIPATDTPTPRPPTETPTPRPTKRPTWTPVSTPVYMVGIRPYGWTPYTMVGGTLSLAFPPGWEISGRELYVVKLDGVSLTSPSVKIDSSPNTDKLYVLLDHNGVIEILQSIIKSLGSSLDRSSVVDVGTLADKRGSAFVYGEITDSRYDITTVVLMTVVREKDRAALVTWIQAKAGIDDETGKTIVKLVDSIQFEE